MQETTHSFQVHMEYSSGEIICWATKQASVNLRKLKSCQSGIYSSYEVRNKLWEETEADMGQWTG